MIDAIIAGMLHGKPTQRTGQSGKPFVTCKVRTAHSDGEATFVSVVVFDEGVAESLLALGDGDSVALSGSLTSKVPVCGGGRWDNQYRVVASNRWGLAAAESGQLGNAA